MAGDRADVEMFAGFGESDSDRRVGGNRDRRFAAATAVIVLRYLRYVVGLNHEVELENVSNDEGLVLSPGFVEGRVVRDRPSQRVSDNICHGLSGGSRRRDR